MGVVLVGAVSVASVGLGLSISFLGLKAVLNLMDLGRRDGHEG